MCALFSSIRPATVVRRSGVAATAALVAAVLAWANPVSAGQLTIGSVNDFMTGSNDGNPAGTWRQGDKTYTYVSSGGWNGSEEIQITDSPGPMIHSFAIGSLGDYGNTNLSLRYHLHVVDPAYWVHSVALDVLHLINGAVVTKNIYGDSDFSQLVASLVSIDGSHVDYTPIGDLVDVYVEDTISLTGDGLISSIGNTYQQATVPEIDMASFAAVGPFVMGCLGLLERRGRRRSSRIA